MTDISPHLLINQSSGNVEIYTPSAIIEAARRTMSGIDLDPASSETANLRVKATRFFTQADDGLSKVWHGKVWHGKVWHGKVWQNHPFSRALNAKWINKLVSEYKAGNITAACAICFASTSEKWFRPLLDYPQCFLTPRTNYLLPDGTVYRGVTKGSVVTYLGSDTASFAREFAALGVVKILYST